MSHREQILLIFLSLACSLGSIVLFALNGESNLIKFGWLCSLALIFLSGIKRVKKAKADWLELLVFGGLLLVSFYLRFYNLSTLPDDFHGDMASVGIEAREYILGEKNDWFTSGWAEIPFLGFAPAIISMSIFGNNLFGLNMSAVVGGVLTIVATYLLMKELFGRWRLALLAAVILAINVPHIHFSRLASYMDPWPWLILSSWLLAKGWRSKKPGQLALAGLLAGIGSQMYYSGRVVVIFWGIWLFYLLIRRNYRQQLKERLLILFFAFIGFFIAWGPSLWYFKLHPYQFSLRSNEVFLFYQPVIDHLQNKYGVTTVSAVVWRQAEISGAMFTSAHDSSSQFGWKGSMFGPWLGWVVWAGLLICLIKIKKFSYFLVLSWVGAIMIFGSWLTGDAPFWPRLVGILPLAASASALALDQLLASAKKARIVIIPFLIYLLVWTGLANFYSYLQVGSDNARPQAKLGRAIAQLPINAIVCGQTSPYLLNIRETQFLAWPRTLINIPTDNADTEILRLNYPFCFRPNSYWATLSHELDLTIYQPETN